MASEPANLTRPSKFRQGVIALHFQYFLYPFRLTLSSDSCIPLLCLSSFRIVQFSSSIAVLGIKLHPTFVCDRLISEIFLLLVISLINIISWWTRRSRCWGGYARSQLAMGIIGWWTSIPMAIRTTHWTGRRPTNWRLWHYLASWLSQCKLNRTRSFQSIF